MGKFLTELPKVAELRVVVRFSDRVALQLLVARLDVVASVGRSVVVDCD